MQPKLLQTEHALFLIEEWDQVNRSGMRPKSNLILVRSDECAPYTAGGIGLPDEIRERHTQACETGIIIAVGSQAFKVTHDGRRWPDDDEEKPKVGERVWFQRYSGSMHRGFDGKAYRLMNDSLIGATFDPDMAPFIEPARAESIAAFAAGFAFPTGGSDDDDAAPAESVSIPGAENVVDVAGGPVIPINEEI